MADLKTVKKIIISLFNMHPRGISQDELMKQYRLTEGQCIPYATFGYSTLNLFLKNELMENVRIVDSGFNVMLYPIANTTSGHVVDLILQQDNPKIRKSPANHRNQHR